LFSNKVPFREKISGSQRIHHKLNRQADVHHHQCNADKFRNYTISTNDLGIAPELYLVQVKTVDGSVEMKRAVKA
jgi:hypothetical protein